MTESLEPPDAPRDSPDPEVREFWDKTMPASMIATTFLKNGSSKIKPAHVVFVSSSPSLVTMFLFSRSLALERNSKGLSFESSIGRLSLKATFELKDMIQADGAGL
jgi:hypothetical protein